MTTLDVAELLAEIRALRKEVLDIKLQMARQEGVDLHGEVKELSKRVRDLELWRSGLAALASAASAGAIAAIAKAFGA